MLGEFVSSNSVFWSIFKLLFLKAKYVATMLASIPPVNNKVKGLLKGLRYISQIFDEEDKGEEMVIGNPTDVKHVAHIGWDGPQVTNPPWMTELHSAPLSTTFGNDGRESGSPNSASQEIPPGRIPPPSPSRDELLSLKARRARHHGSSEAPGCDSPARERGTRHSRKNQSVGSAPGSESLSRDEESSRRGRRHHKSDSNIGSGCDSPAPSLPSIPKDKKERRSSKGSGDGGSSRSSHRYKDHSLSNLGAEGRISAPVRVEGA